MQELYKSIFPFLAKRTMDFLANVNSALQREEVGRGRGGGGRGGGGRKCERRYRGKVENSSEMEKFTPITISGGDWGHFVDPHILR